MVLTGASQRCVSQLCVSGFEKIIINSKIQKRVHTAQHSAWACGLGRTSLWEIPPGSCDFTQQRYVIGHSPFSTNLPSVFAEGKWLREGFPHWHEDLRQLVLWEAIE